MHFSIWLFRTVTLPLALLGIPTGCSESGCGNDEKDYAVEPAHAAGLVEGALPPGDPGNVDVTFEIRADSAARPISPLIYGVNFDLRGVAEQRWGLMRHGGNRLSAYNWENNASNAGSDYLYQNDSLMSDTDQPAKPVLALIDTAASVSAPAIVTLSNQDYVAADKNGGGDVRTSGADYLKTRFKRNFAKKPSAFSALPDTQDDAVYQDELVAFLRAARPNARLLFSMDNEPELWHHTHAEVFPTPVTYEVLWQRNYEFAKAAKQVSPNSEVLGFVSYGYAGFQNLQNASDAKGRGFIEWYLDQAKAAERKLGKRLIDYLDLHWYPEAHGGNERIVGDSTAPETVRAREQAPRSLWDPKYREKSWISDAAGGPINLINWLKAKIDAHYPGTKLAFTEWNYGGGNHISGAIAVADVLGIFGRHGIAIGAYWPLSDREAFAFAAFRAYRNYDGRGGAFGDTSIEASTSDSTGTSVYASIDSNNPKRTVVMAINKTERTKKAGVRITHSAAYGTAKVFVLAGTQALISQGAPLPATAPNAFNYPMPPQSVSILVLEP